MFWLFSGDEFNNMASIPLGGDQLTRVTFDSARVLRSGTHSRTERFDQLSPVIEKLFHVQQDLLEVCEWYLYSDSFHIG